MIFHDFYLSKRALAKLILAVLSACHLMVGCAKRKPVFSSICCCSMKPSNLLCLFILIGFALVLGGPSENQETKFPNQESKTGNQQKSESGEHRKPSDTNAEPAPVSPAIVPPEKSHSAPEEKKNDKRAEPRNWFDWYAALGPPTWSQWALTVLAAIAAVAAWRTFGAMQRQLEISERAWVTVKFDIPYKLGDPFVAFSLINTGKTPAHIKQSSVIRFDPSEIGTPIPWTPGPVPRNAMDTTWSLAPGESLQQRWDVKISQDEIKGVMSKTQRLTIYGFILYDDIFGKRNRTTFYRIFSADTARDKGVFIIPPETEARPGQNEAT
jgi:hypothetical protein